MNRERITRFAPLGATMLALCLGCEGSPVPQSSVPRPELEQAIDKNSIEYKKILADPSIPR